MRLAGRQPRRLPLCIIIRIISRENLPEASVVIKHLAGAVVLAWVTEAGVDLVLTLVAMVTRCALAAVLFEAHQVTGSSVLTRMSKTHITLG